MSPPDGVIAWPHVGPERAQPPIDVRAARRALGLTQAAFARFCGIPLADLRGYERGGPIPCPTIRVLLTLIARNPDVVRRAFDLR